MLYFIYCTNYFKACNQIIYSGELKQISSSLWSGFSRVVEAVRENNEMKRQNGQLFWSNNNNDGQPGQPGRTEGKEHDILYAASNLHSMMWRFKSFEI